jgi:hypothetical protein
MRVHGLLSPNVSRGFLTTFVRSIALKSNRFDIAVQLSFVAGTWNTIQTLCIRRRQTPPLRGMGHLRVEHGLLPRSWPAGPQAVKVHQRGDTEIQSIVTRHQ